MKQELEKIYSPNENEDKIYEKWERSGLFNPDNLNLPKSAKDYTIVLPPPNITAKLHIGHSAMLAIEDLLIRYHRMLGERTLWLPGTDHAAIATQNVVEKKILMTSGKTRHDLGREKFLEEVWKFVNETQATILLQTKKMGSSLDWSRLTFTLDEERKRAVKTMFLDMYREGVIYRGERIVNWCPKCHSTLADDEVEHREQKAKLYTFKYDQNFPIAISTTRPETKLGDVAVAVNSKDERYKKYIGQEYEVDFCGQKLKIKIISDYNVEPEFGTGALGVTPAHSMIDWQMAQANDLPIIKVVNEDALIRNDFGAYSGLKIEEAREMIVNFLIKENLLEKEEEIINNLSVCYRCDTPIEPLPSKQWFISVDKKLDRLGGKSLKEKALEAAEKKDIQFFPERFSKNFKDWMFNLHDWCISRQIWYGHEIPVWYKGEEIYVGEKTPEGDGWTHDQDTLDTWFSSGMWTFSTLGWPDNYKNNIKSGDLSRFHPTQVIETGYDILTLWVSRMIMMSFFALQEIPFEKVYLHGTVLDKNGKKMSKSKGNGVDPLDIIDKYGADALRLSLLMGSTPGNDSRYNEEVVEIKRNFINKLWNISRYILGSVSESALKQDLNIRPRAKTLADRWILLELNNLVAGASKHLDDLNFSFAADELSEFTWSKLADWYLEVAKIEKDKDEILVYLLKNLLILWHPFIPYVTETVWQSISSDLLMVTAWPKNTSEENKESGSFKVLIEVVTAIRNARSVNKIEPSQKLKAFIYGHKYLDLLVSQRENIKNLKTGLSEVTICESGEKVEQAITAVVGEIEIYLVGEIDVVKEKERLQKETANLEKIIGLQEKKLQNKEFIVRAPESIVNIEKEKLASYKKELFKVENSLKSL
ncbi:MAG: valine--tRNA ligase [Patescibacteria group bacterium]|jgi:valyl-tRNA synthetase